ncbi:MAG: ATP-binding cassette domain-containing protein [Anaerorhabdus sp.]
MIKLHKIKKYYDDKCVLDIDEFEFIENRIYAIMGNNGCGKSTLLKSIMNVIKLDKGQVETELLDDIYYLPQNPFIFKGSVKDNLFSRNTNLNLNDFENMLDKNALSLSGGEKQKMLLIRTILQDKSILLLDEPTSDMDVEGTIKYEGIIKDYKQKNSATIIIVTHSLSQAVRLSDTIIFMSNSKIVEYGDSKDIIEKAKSPQLKKFVAFHQVK